MRRRRTRPAGQSGRASVLSGLRLWILAAGLGVVVLLAVWELASSGKGAPIAAKLFGVRNLAERAQALDRALDAALVQLGTLDLKTEEEAREAGRTRWPHWTKVGRTPPGADLLQCNLAITKAVKAEGGAIQLVRERPRDWRGGRTLDMRLGLGGIETHQVVLRETPGAAARPAAKPRVAIVIDDLGYGTSDAMRDVLEIEEPLTVTIVPHYPGTSAAAEAARQAGKEVLLHLPMEPLGYPGVNPGEGALLTSHTAQELRELLAAAVAEVPQAVGISNHMGSAFTADRAQMRVLMAAIKPKGLFFLDSMTTAASVGLSEAKRAGVPVARNSMFIDSKLDEQGRVDVRAQLASLESVARRRGWAIAIGHPRRETVSALKSELKAMRERGIEFVFVSELVGEGDEQ